MSGEAVNTVCSWKNELILPFLGKERMDSFKRNPHMEKIFDMNYFSMFVNTWSTRGIIKVSALSLLRNFWVSYRKSLCRQSMVNCNSKQLFSVLFSESKKASSTYQYRRENTKFTKMGNTQLLYKLEMLLVVNTAEGCTAHQLCSYQSE